MELLERGELLAQLQALRQRAGAGQGLLALVEGEAGIGKTALLRAFAESERAALPVFWGACDPLQTPRPLGPLHDVAAAAGAPARLRHLLDSDGERSRVFGAFVELLAAEPTLVVFEDLHWADEATLDLVRYAGRRIAGTRSLLIASCRNDELGPSHPLRLLLGDLATSGMQRFAPAPLSLDAVRRLAGGEAIDVAALHSSTAGNPFFVTEVLATGGVGIPATVRDAVLARAARLRPSARAILDAVAVAGTRVEPWLLDDVVGAETDAIEDCRAAGVLRVDGNTFGFRHELARQAVLEALSPARSQSLHRLVLQALQSPAAPPADLARLAHHAEAAGLGDEVRRLAPAAARRAAAMGAHRQACEQYARALRHAGPEAAERAELLGDYAAECQLVGMLEAAIDARRGAAECWREAGDAERRALSLARVAVSLVLFGRRAEGEASLQEALGLIAGREDTPVTLATRRWAASLRMLERDVDQAIAEGERAMAGAERLGDRETVLDCLNTVGSSLIVSGRVDEGRQRLERSLAMAEELRLDAQVANALGNLGSAAGEAYRFDLAEPYLRRTIVWCAERDLDGWRLYALAWLALVQLYRGQWSEAAANAHEVLANRFSNGIARMTARLALGRLRARRGDPGVWQALDEVSAWAGPTGSLQRVAPMRAARAEAAWLEGDRAATAREASFGLALALEKRHAWFASELTFWSRQGSVPASADLPGFCRANPFALEAEGCWQEAAAAWRALGCPFETARALSVGDEAAQREALAIFESLGAAPMIERLRRSLRAAGVRGLPRGPRDSTRSNPAGVTAKELQVLALLAQGLRNKEIGERMSRSTRTVDHHLASIFVKLGVATRTEAVDAAHRLALIPLPEPLAWR